MSGAIVVIGSLHYDVMIDSSHLPQLGETVAGSRWYPKFGGKGGNQALAAHAAGARVRMLGAVGSDDFAPFILDTLRNAGVATTDIEIIDGEGTGMSVAISDSDGDYGAVIVSGANLRINPERLGEDDLWHGASLLMLQNEITPELNREAARQAKLRGVRVCLNAAPARGSDSQLDALVDVLIVNGLEAEAMCGQCVRDLVSASVACETLAARFKTVVVTAGEHGVAASAKEAGKQHQVVALPAKPIKVVSTHGAGDRFCGVLCAELARGQSLSSALGLANEAAAVHVAGSTGLHQSTGVQNCT